jgi:Transmembrane protein 231
MKRSTVLRHKNKCFFLGFWRKVETYEEQPDIHFLHQLILILETDQPDNPITWSTMQNYNHLLGGDSTRIPTIKVL